VYPQRFVIPEPIDFLRLIYLSYWIWLIFALDAPRILGEQKDFEVYSCNVSPDGLRLATAAGGNSPSTKAGELQELK
jgi:hypothetical protein